MSVRRPRSAISVAPENDAMVGKVAGRYRGYRLSAGKAGGSPRLPMQVMLLGSRPSLRSRDPQRARHARTVCRVRPRAVLHMALLDVRPCITHRAGGVLEQRLPLRRRHLAEQIARLLPVIIVDAVVPMRSLAVHRHRRLGEIGLIIPEPVAVGIEAERTAQIVVRP